MREKKNRQELNRETERERENRRAVVSGFLELGSLNLASPLHDLDRGTKQGEKIAGCRLPGFRSRKFVVVEAENQNSCREPDFFAGLGRSGNAWTELPRRKKFFAGMALRDGSGREKISAGPEWPREKTWPRIQIGGVTTIGILSL